MIRRATLVFFGLAVFGCGSSAPPATSTPTPVTTPTAPAPVPTTSTFVCPLPAQPDLHNECPKLRDGGKLQEVVSRAVDRTIQQHPEYFDLSQNRGGAVKVLDRSKYIGAVVDNVHVQGVCAVEQKEEIALKDTNAYHEQYNIWTSDGYVRLGPGAYVTTCYPAQF